LIRFPKSFDGPAAKKGKGKGGGDTRLQLQSDTEDTGKKKKRKEEKRIIVTPPLQKKGGKGGEGRANHIPFFLGEGEGKGKEKEGNLTVENRFPPAIEKGGGEGKRKDNNTAKIVEPSNERGKEEREEGGEVLPDSDGRKEKKRGGEGGKGESLNHFSWRRKGGKNREGYTDLPVKDRTGIRSGKERKKGKGEKSFSLPFFVERKRKGKKAPRFRDCCAVPARAEERGGATWNGGLTGWSRQTRVRVEKKEKKGGTRTGGFASLLVPLREREKKGKGGNQLHHWSASRSHVQKRTGGGGGKKRDPTLCRC